jgi:hypothetical protein
MWFAHATALQPFREILTAEAFLHPNANVLVQGPPSNLKTSRSMRGTMAGGIPLSVQKQTQCEISGEEEANCDATAEEKHKIECNF